MRRRQDVFVERVRAEEEEEEEEEEEGEEGDGEAQDAGADGRDAMDKLWLVKIPQTVAKLWGMGGGWGEGEEAAMRAQADEFLRSRAGVLGEVVMERYRPKGRSQQPWQTRMRVELEVPTGSAAPKAYTLDVHGRDGARGSGISSLSRINNKPSSSLSAPASSTSQRRRAAHGGPTQEGGDGRPLMLNMLEVTCDDTVFVSGFAAPEEESDLWRWLAEEGIIPAEVQAIEADFSGASADGDAQQDSAAAFGMAGGTAGRSGGGAIVVVNIEPAPAREGAGDGEGSNSSTTTTTTTSKNNRNSRLTGKQTRAVRGPPGFLVTFGDADQALRALSQLRRKITRDRAERSRAGGKRKARRGLAVEFAKRLIVGGYVNKHCTLKPMSTQEYHQFCRTRNYHYNMGKPETVLLDSHEPQALQPGEAAPAATVAFPERAADRKRGSLDIVGASSTAADTGEGRPRKRERPDPSTKGKAKAKAKGKAADVDGARNTMFELFATREHLKYKEIKAAVSLPDSQLRPLVEQYCHFHPRGPYHMHYELRDEFKVQSRAK